MRAAILPAMPVGAKAQLALEDFLSAPICEQQNGMPLTVMSAFARLNVDPLKEAVRLAGLPPAVAATTLTKIIGRLLSSAVLFDATSTAARLVKLLPTLDAADVAAATSATEELPEHTRPSERPKGIAIWQIALILALAAVVIYGS
jgi:hypothetical protein